jgi:hypothetical protein
MEKICNKRFFREIDLLARTITMNVNHQNLGRKRRRRRRRRGGIKWGETVWHKFI